MYIFRDALSLLLFKAMYFLSVLWCECLSFSRFFRGGLFYGVSMLLQFEPFPKTSHRFSFRNFSLIFFDVPASTRWKCEFIIYFHIKVEHIKAPAMGVCVRVCVTTTLSTYYYIVVETLWWRCFKITCLVFYHFVVDENDDIFFVHVDVDVIVHHHVVLIYFL